MKTPSSTRHKQFLSTAFSLLFLFLHTFSWSQDVENAVPRFEKVDVGTRGEKIYMIKGTPAFEVTLSEDGSRVYTTEGTHGDHNFAAIVVEFDPVMEDASPEEMEALMESYLEFLQGQFGITGSIGVGKGHFKDNLPLVRGVIDYWEDEEGTQYAIKAWVNNSMMSVLMIYGPTSYPNFNVQQMYFNGFRFPGED